jgi:hypothetical protein
MEQKNTNPLAVDLDQSPDDFKKLLMDDEGGAATTEESAAGKADKPADPQDNAEQPADEPKTGEEVTEPESKTQPAEGTEKEPEVIKPDVNEQRHKDAQREIQRRADEKKRAVEALADLAKADVSNLDTVAKRDPVLADAAVKEAFGFETLQDYKSHLRIQELKETNPDEAEREERLTRLEKVFQESKENTRKTFLESKGVSTNRFDDNYLKVEEKLKLLSPDYVESNYAEALATAYNLAFPQTAPSPEKVELQNAVNKNSSDKIGNSVKQPHSTGSGYSDEQSAFAAIVGVQL